MLENLFICIGAQKAGTTWLHTALTRDPTFSRCPYVKEVHYFDLVHKKSPHLNNWRAHHFLRLGRREPAIAKFQLAREMDRRVKRGPASDADPADREAAKLTRPYRHLLSPVNDAWYCNLLAPARGQDWAIDVTPDYAVIGEDGFRHMRTLARKLRLLFILRDPVERAWSGLLQGYKRKPGGIAGFAETGLHDTRAIVTACTKGDDVGARSDYVATLDALAVAGLEDDVLIKLYDDIGRVPLQFIADVYQHLGKTMPSESAEEGGLGERVHSTEAKLEMPAAVRAALKEFYQPKIERLAKRVPIPTTWWM